MLFFLIAATAHWHAKRGHAQQATAAQEAAAHLRAAYQNAAAAPLDALRRRGGNLGSAQRQRQAQVVRAALPELAAQILTEPGWYALAATLSDAEVAGYDSSALLTKAAAYRELDTAQSVSDVLVWRLRRTADLPADTTVDVRGEHSAKRSGHSRRPMAQGQPRSRRGQA